MALNTPVCSPSAGGKLRAIRPVAVGLLGLLLAWAAPAAAAESVHEAIAAGNAANAMALMTADPKLINQPNANLETPLYLAAQQGMPDLVKWLLGKGAEVDAPGPAGKTPLHIAAQNNKLSVVQILVERGASLTVRDKNGRDALGAAKSHPWKAIVDYIEQAQAKKPAPAGQPPSMLPEVQKSVEGDRNLPIKTLLAEHPEQVHAVTASGVSALEIAASCDYKEAVIALLDGGAAIDYQDPELHTALHRAAKNGNLDCVKVLVERGANLELREKFKNQTPLEMAVDRKHPDIAAYLKAAAGGGGGVGEVHSIADFEDPQHLVTWEFKEGSGSLDPAHATSGKQALKTQTGALISAWRVQPSDWSAYDSFEFDLFLEGAVPAKVTVMLVDQACVDSGTGYYERHVSFVPLKPGANTVALPVHALHRGEPDRRSTKLPGNLDPTKIVRVDILFDAQTPAAVVHMDSLRLVKTGAGGGAAGGLKGLLLAIGKGDLAQATALIEATPALIAQTDPQGRTPLHQAVTATPAIAELLVVQKADVNRADRDNWRPIHIAAEAGRADMVALLLKNQADPNATATLVAQTPLYIAAEYGFTEVVKQLLAGRANPNLNTAAGITPLHRAAGNGYIDIVSLLILAKADLNVRDSAGKTALDYAAAAGRTEIATLLAKHGATGTVKPPAGEQPAPTGGIKADPNAKLDPEQSKKFVEACGKGEVALVTAMLDADPNMAFARDGIGYTGLHLLPAVGDRADVTLAKRMLDLGVPIDICHDFQRTPLMRAAEFGSLPLVKLYLERGADVNAADGAGWTALMFSCRDGNSVTQRAIVTCLLEHKADGKSKDVDLQLTAHGWAKKGNHAEVLKILEAHGITE